MRKMIGEMDILVAQLSSELKFIKNGSYNLKILKLIFLWVETIFTYDFIIKHFHMPFEQLILCRSANGGHVNVKFIEIQVLIFQHCPPLQLLLA